jgi:hypothetical protein
MYMCQGKHCAMAPSQHVGLQAAITTSLLMQLCPQAASCPWLSGSWILAGRGAAALRAALCTVPVRATMEVSEVLPEVTWSWNTVLLQMFGDFHQFSSSPICITMGSGQERITNSCGDG